jgi:hypothetical protein
MKIRLIGATTLVVLAVFAAACSKNDSHAQATALQQQIIGAGSDSVACKLFTADQIADALGRAVDDGATSGPLGSACSWSIKGEHRSVMVQIVPRDYWEDGSRAPDAQVLEGIGEKAFVGRWLDDQRAGALTANGAVYVMSPNKDTSVTLLRDAAPRVPAQ